MKTLLCVLAFVAGMYAGDAAVTALDSGSSMSRSLDLNDGALQQDAV